MKRTCLRAAIAASLVAMVGLGAGIAAPAQAFYQPPQKDIYGTPSLPLVTSVAVDQRHPDIGSSGFPSYWGFVDDLGVVAHGDAPFLGNPPEAVMSGTVVANPVGTGYWVVDAVGGKVTAFGDATKMDPLNVTVYELSIPPIADAVATPDGHGILALDSVGRVWTTGSAQSFGDVIKSKPRRCQNNFSYSSAAIRLTPAGTGYWILGSAGEVWGFGENAPSYGDGCAAKNTYNTFVTSMAVTPDGAGYWLGTLNGHLLSCGSAAPVASLSGVDDLTYLAAVPAGGMLAARESGGVIWVHPRAATERERGRPPQTTPVCTST